MAHGSGQVQRAAQQVDRLCVGISTMAEQAEYAANVVAENGVAQLLVQISRFSSRDLQENLMFVLGRNVCGFIGRQWVTRRWLAVFSRLPDLVDVVVAKAREDIIHGRVPRVVGDGHNL